jgi:predicted 3-demethylubiquinone-9 3-methyltransferase (glyoxalase superfamily)
LQGITTFFMFNEGAEEAANLYTSLFPNSKILNINRATPAGLATSVEFQLFGTHYVAYNGGPHFNFCEGISLFVHCDTQEEVDTLWERLTEDGGQESQCGWLKDRFGVSWQIIPGALMELMGDPDPAKSRRTVDAMLKMGKIDIATLRMAHAGE